LLITGSTSLSRSARGESNGWWIGTIDQGRMFCDSTLSSQAACTWPGRITPAVCARAAGSTSLLFPTCGSHAHEDR